MATDEIARDREDASRNAADPMPAEPGRGPSGASVGGVRATTESGVADWAQRSTERGEEPAVDRVSTGNASGGAGGPRIDLGGKNAPGSAPGASTRSDRPASDDAASPPASGTAGTGAPGETPSSSRVQDDDEDEWRHPPVKPIDEPNPLDSLGKAIGDTLTGPSQDTPGTPDGPEAPKR